MTFPFAAIGFEHPHIYSMIDSLRALEGAKLVALADKNQGQLSEAVSKYGVQPYEDYRLMLDEVKPQAVALAAINREKADILMECIERGIHVFADKPLLTTEEDLKRVNAVLKKKNIVISLYLTYRYTPMTYTMKKIIDNGKIGKVVYAIINLPHRLNIPMRTHAMINEELNGGVIVDIACHGYDLVRWYTGSEVLEVTAYHGNMRFTERRDFKDYGMSFFRMMDESTAFIGADWLAPDGGGAKPLILLVGTKGTLEIKADSKEVILCTNDRPPQIIQPQGPELSVAEDFYAAIKSPAHERVLNNTDVLQAMAGVILAKQAAESGRTIRVI